MFMPYHRIDRAPHAAGANRSPLFAAAVTSAISISAAD
jgi:hypothetical protein